MYRKTCSIFLASAATVGLLLGGGSAARADDPNDTPLPVGPSVILSGKPDISLSIEVCDLLSHECMTAFICEKLHWKPPVCRRFRPHDSNYFPSDDSYYFPPIDPTDDYSFPDFPFPLSLPPANDR